MVGGKVGRIFIERTPNGKTHREGPQWSYYETREDIDRLLQYLNTNGIRERALGAELMKYYENFTLMLPYATRHEKEQKIKEKEERAERQRHRAEAKLKRSTSRSGRHSDRLAGTAPGENSEQKEDEATQEHKAAKDKDTPTSETGEAGELADDRMQVEPSEPSTEPASIELPRLVQAKEVGCVL